MGGTWNDRMGMDYNQRTGESNANGGGTGEVAPLLINGNHAQGQFTAEFPFGNELEEEPYIKMRGSFDVKLGQETTTPSPEALLTQQQRKKIPQLQQQIKVFKAGVQQLQTPIARLEQRLDPIKTWRVAYQGAAVPPIASPRIRAGAQPTRPRPIEPPPAMVATPAQLQQRYNAAVVAFNQGKTNEALPQLENLANTTPLAPNSPGTQAALLAMETYVWRAEYPSAAALLRSLLRAMPNTDALFLRNFILRGQRDAFLNSPSVQQVLASVPAQTSASVRRNFWRDGRAASQVFRAMEQSVRKGLAAKGAIRHDAQNYSTYHLNEDFRWPDRDYHGECRFGRV